VPLGYIAVVALLVDGGGGNVSGFGGLLLLPVIWLAILGSPWELLFGLVAVGIARAAPMLAVGAPLHPELVPPKRPEPASRAHADPRARAATPRLER